MSVDVLGLDYYPHSEWYFTRAGGTAPSPFPQGLCTLILEYAERYRLPLWLTETNIRGTSADRASWLKHTLEECERAALAGAPLTAYCWFPTIDSCDWGSLLARADGHIDPGLISGVDPQGDAPSRFFPASARLPSSPAPALPLVPVEPPPVAVPSSYSCTSACVHCCQSLPFGNSAARAVVVRSGC